MNYDPNRVTFGETDQPTQSFSPQRKSQFIVTLLMNLSGGLIKDERQATIFILVAFVCSLLFSWVLYSSSKIDLQEQSSRNVNSLKSSPMGRPVRQ